MKIIEIINEGGPLPFTREKVDNAVISELRTKCAPFIAECGGLWNAISDRPLWRGIPDFDWDEYKLPIITVDVNQNRSPRDTANDRHKIVNEWFIKKTGIPFRNASVFGSGSYKIAKNYATDFDANPGVGETVVVLPVGKYSYCWSDKVEDLYSYLGDHVTWSKDTTENEQDIYTVLNNAEYKFNKDLGQALDSRNEIMVHCQKAIILNESYRKYLINEYKYQ